MNNNQKLFCLEYIKNGFNGTRAYMEVYKPKSEEIAMASSSRLLRNVKIKEYIEKHQEKLEQKSLVSIENIAKELYNIGFFDIRKLYNEKGELKDINELDEETSKVVSSIKVQQKAGSMKLEFSKKNKKDDVSIEHIPEQVIEMKTNDKLKALELLGKYLGMFTEKTKSDVTVTIDESDRELLKNIKDRLK